MTSLFLRLIAAATLTALCACGGGGGGGSGSAPANPAPSGWTTGVFQPSSSFAAQCQSPRSGTDPSTGRPFVDIRGSTLSENNWLRSWTNELYLWYDEVTDRDPSLTASTAAYFDLLKTGAITPSGNPKDKFHFTFDTADWLALSQSGVSAGYGAQWIVLSGIPPREVIVAYTEPNSPATAPAANLARGAEVLSVDGVDVRNSNGQAAVDVLNAGFFPAASGETHSFIVRDPGAVGTRSIVLQSANVASTPVQNVLTIPTSGGPVGYLLFNDHIATAEAGLIDAVNTLGTAGIVDLVLDLRYNGGGFLDIADELAFMIAGTVPTAGRTFERIVFNRKHPSTNPVTGQALTPVPFHTVSQGFSVAGGQPLPALNLPRVFVLTGTGTCSASESIINSLRGVDVQVIQIGSTTCGKPYGFYPFDNCGTTYFSIQFKGENAKGFGDYTDGFSPNNASGAMGTTVPGCSVGDDFNHALGDPAESRLAAALQYRANGSCPAATGISPQKRISGVQAQSAAVGDGLLYKSPWLENRILRDQAPSQ